MQPTSPSTTASLPPWLSEFLPILVLLVVIAIVVAQLPKVDLGHSPAYVRRRVMNWLPVGLTYAFLYMGRYNLNSTIGPVFDKAQFSTIYGWGTLAYGVSFVINGPLTDRLGGKRTIILAAAGALVANVAMGLMVTGVPHVRAGHPELVPLFAVLYAVNMYFQSFGAVSIVKVNSAWFHLRERGTFGGIFGILISLGLYFAFDWCKLILEHAPVQWVFYIPAAILGLFALLDTALVKDTPGGAGHTDFDTGDATEPDPEPAARAGQDDQGYRDAAHKAPARPAVLDVAVKMLKNPAILTIACIEFCSGYLRNSILQYYKPFARELGRTTDFVMNHWGMLNCVAGILGGVLAGFISDHVFGSRRGPVSAVLYGVMVLGGVLMFVTLGSPLIGWVVVLMSLAIIGVHGMLSGTASMDFGGRKNTGIAVGLIDGFVYLGVALEAFVLGKVLPKDAAAHDPHNWWTWPAAILPAAVIGFVLALRVWNARPQRSAASH